jgi:hypothetical protein
LALPFVRAFSRFHRTCLDSLVYLPLTHRVKKPTRYEQHGLLVWYLMRKIRLAIPANSADEVLYRNDHTCCICNEARKHVQIHHIDGDPSNGSIANLAVVCLDCHSRVTGVQGLGRHYGAGEVRQYKRAWEQVVLYRRSKFKPPSRASQRELIGQIDMIMCQILATSDSTRRKELLEVIYNLHLWRGTPQIDRQIIEGFGHLAVMSGLDMPALARELASKVWELCWHFVGPHQVKMDRSGANFVARCADVVESLGTYNCLMERNLRALRAALNTAENLFDVAVWYKNEKIATAVLKVYIEGMKACESRETHEFPGGGKELRRSAKLLARKLRNSKLKWTKVDRTLSAFHKRTALPSPQ